MNDPLEFGMENTGINWRQLDRLVDGELTKVEYDDLLRSLESTPGGWRDCAMAFLEHQAWKRDLSSLSTDTSRFEKPRPIATSTHRPATSSRWLIALSLFAVAGLVAALNVSGWLKQKFEQPDVASNVAERRQQKAAAQPLARSSPKSTNVAGGPPTTVRSSLAQNDASLEDAEEEALVLPIFPLDDEYAKRLLEQRQLPRHVRRSLEKSGYRVTEKRQLAPVQLADGSPAWLPIDEVNVTPVARWTY